LKEVTSDKIYMIGLFPRNLANPETLMTGFVRIKDRIMPISNMRQTVSGLALNSNFQPGFVEIITRQSPLSR
jgi:hypothetical protein